MFVFFSCLMWKTRGSYPHVRGQPSTRGPRHGFSSPFPAHHPGPRAQDYGAAGGKRFTLLDAGPSRHPPVIHLLRRLHGVSTPPRSDSPARGRVAEFVSTCLGATACHIAGLGRGRRPHPRWPASCKRGKPRGDMPTPCPPRPRGHLGLAAWLFRRAEFSNTGTHMRACTRACAHSRARVCITHRRTRFEV